MYEEDVLIGKTTQANEDDAWGKCLVCDECGHEIPLQSPDDGV